MEWDFQPSCQCDVGQQQQINAAYYNRRGLFHLRRGVYEQALSYVKEAVTLDNTPEYWDDYGMALIAVRNCRRDTVLENWLASEVESTDHQRRFHNPDDKNYIFRNEYLQVVGRERGSFERLLARLQKVMGLGESPDWSYRIGSCVYEMPQGGTISRESTNVAELPGNGPERSDDVEADSRSLSRIVATNSAMQRPSSKPKSSRFA